MSDKKIVYVCHGMYGCETGCCGYNLCPDDEGDEHVLGTNFSFSHPRDDESVEDFAIRQWGRDFDFTNVEVRQGKWYPGWDC